jgi:hypothetical protein
MKQNSQPGESAPHSHFCPAITPEPDDERPFGSPSFTLVWVPTSGKRRHTVASLMGLEEMIGWRWGEVGCSLSYGGATLEEGVTLTSVIDVVAWDGYTIHHSDCTPSQRSLLDHV